VAEKTDLRAHAKYKLEETKAYVSEKNEDLPVGRIEWRRGCRREADRVMWSASGA